MWASRRAYIDLVQALAATSEVREACRRHEIAVTTWCAVMTSAAMHADGRTGELRAEKAIVAADCTREAKTVQRALAIAAEFGIAMELYRGRELGRDERMALAAEFGRHPQRGIPSVWQLAYIPPLISRRFTRLTRQHAGRWVIYLGPQLVDSADSLGLRPPSPLGAAFRVTNLQLLNLHSQRPATSGRRTDAASPRRSPKKACDPRRNAAAATLAAQMALQLPWLDGEAVSRLTPCLMRFATANVAWTAADVIAALTDQGLRRGQRLLDLDPHQIHTRPAVVLAGLLRDLDVDADHPRLVELEIDQRRAQHDAAAAIPPHECDRGWVNVVDEHGRHAVTRCIGGPACARSPHHDDQDDDPAQAQGRSAVMPAAVAAELDARLRGFRVSRSFTPLTVDQAHARLRALPDWGRALLAAAPPDLTADEAAVWAAAEHVRRLS
ncbi:hypothetical protein [Calidifontibacter indicus]|nr:hypothetical protein [Calidifontibacter indicus]